MINKKNKRKIIVDYKEYWWQVHYDGDCFRPYIYISTDKNKLIIKQSFDKEMIVSGEYISKLIKKHVFSEHKGDIDERSI